jgi:hypothetical protein
MEPHGVRLRALRLYVLASGLEGENGSFLVLLGFGRLADNLINQLGNLSLKPNVAALRADEGGHVFNAVELLTPGLGVGDGLFLQRTATLGAYVVVTGHTHSFRRDQGSIHILGSY